MDVTLPQAAEQKASSAYAFWDYLTEPKPFVPENERRRARLLSGLLLLFAVTASIVMFFAGWLTTEAPVISVFAMWAAYILSRTKFYNVAAYVAVLVPNSLAIYAIVISENASLNTLAVVIVFILLANLLVSLRGTIIVMALNIVFITIAPLFNPEHLITLPLAVVITGSVLLIVFSIYRDRLEQDRQAQLKESLQRTEEANKTLMKANALAKETVRLKSEFMSTMSHELRTPLNAITGFCGIMLEGMGGEIDNEARHMIERVHSNSERLLTLINQVLDIAKIEADRIDLSNEPFAPHDLVERWKAQVQVLAAQKGLTFQTSIDPALPATIYGDSERITQIVTNLLSNAFKFTEQGTVELRLKAGQTTWQIEVQDTGIGIPPHAQNYIFDEFRQLDGSSTRVYGGTGLGLAIVRKLSLLMGGNVRVASTLGEGSTFTVTLPLNTDATTHDPILSTELQTEQ